MQWKVDVEKVEKRRLHSLGIYMCGEKRTKKKFAIKPIFLKEEGIKIAFGWYYITERFIPTWEGLHNEQIELFKETGRISDKSRLSGRWSLISIESPEQYFINKI